MENPCARCGTPNPASNTACTGCAAPLPGSAATPAAGAPAGPSTSSAHGPAGWPVAGPSAAPPAEPGYGPGYDHPPQNPYAGGYFPAAGAPAAELASVGIRIGGFLVDSFTLGVISVLVTLPLDIASATGSLSGGTSLGVDVLSTLFGIAAFIAYYIVPTALYGQTLGKKIVGTKVVREANGQVPGWGPAFGRYAILYLMNLPLYLPSIICASLMNRDPKIRGWHDRVAKTIVIRTR